MKNQNEKNKEAIDVHIDFLDVNYTSLPSAEQIKNTVECNRKLSIESVHNLRAIKPTNYFETLTHLIKSNVGCGILGLGLAFKNGGLMLSVIMIFVFTFVSCYNQHILINMANNFKRKYNRSSISFGETISIAFENGPPLFQRLSSFIRKLINFFLIATQLGACCVYILFISQSLEQLFDCYGFKINIHVIMVLVLPFIWITALIRQLKYIAFLSTLANLSISAGLVLILRSSLTNLEPISSRKFIGRLEDWPISFGMMVFTMEGISLTLPLEQNMKKPEKFLGTFGALNVASVIVGVLMAMMGFFGYWKFGDQVQGSLTFGLDIKDNLLLQGVIGTMILGIMCTYALQFFVPIMIIMSKINRYVSKWPYQENNVYEYLLRSILVLLTILVAEVIPHFNLFSSLIGAVGGSFLAFVFCPLAVLIVKENKEYGKCYWDFILAVFSLIIGIATFIFGTLTTSRQIIIVLKNDLYMAE